VVIDDGAVSGALLNVLVGYGSRFGSTREIAERMAATLRARGLTVDLRPAEDISGVDRYDAVVLGSGVYDDSWTVEARGDVRAWVAIALALACRHEHDAPRRSARRARACTADPDRGAGERGTLASCIVHLHR